MQQNTPEWIQARVGYVTASMFPVIKKSGGGWTGTANNYLYELVGEHMTGQQAGSARSKAMDWGNNYEDEARNTYIFETGRDVAEKGFYPHPVERWIGASPDGGLTAEEGLVEIKCPYTTREHVRTLLKKTVPPQYIDQVQGQLWVTGKQWCDFVSYDPRMKDKGLVIVRVDRDEAVIEELADRIIKFRDLVLKQLEKANG